MKKFFFVAYLILSVFFLFYSVRELFSISVSQPGDMVSCRDNFKYCTDGGCMQSDRTFAVSCQIKNCANGCKKYKNGVCVKWNYWKKALKCTGGEIPGMPGFICEPFTLISTGICVPIRIIK